MSTPEEELFNIDELLACEPDPLFNRMFKTWSRWQFYADQVTRYGTDEFLLLCEDDCPGDLAP